MSGATARLPDLKRATDASRNAQTGLTGFLSVTGALASDSQDSPLQGVARVVGGLEAALQIDVSGLSERLPQTISTIENALPADTLRFVEEIKDSYQEVRDFLSNSALVQQIHPGLSLEQTALALVDDVLDLFKARLQSLGSSLFDAQTLERVKTALSTIEDLAAGPGVNPEELVEFLSQNLLGITADFLSGARTHLSSALAVLDPWSPDSLEAHIAASRDALTTAFQDLANGLRDFDASDLSAYTTVESRLQTLENALDTAFAALEVLYAVLTEAVASPAWDSLFDAYASVLGAIDLESVPTVDDAVDAMAGTVESLLTRLGMSLSPEDLATAVARASGSLHEMFAQSPLSQVRQILIDFIEKIQAALDQVPAKDVQNAVEGMLHRVHQAIQDLGIEEVRTSIRNGFNAAHAFVDQNIDGNAYQGLRNGVQTALDLALKQLQDIPVAELGQELATAVRDAGEVTRELENNITEGIEEIETLLASLDRIDFCPVADEVVDEIHALKSRLSAIKPESLSDAERVAIQAGLSLLRAIDLEDKIENRLKKEFAALGAELTRAIQATLDAWLEFRRRIGGLDGASLAAEVSALLEQAGNAVNGINGTLVVAPLQTRVDDLMDKARLLSPEAILEPLQEPYDRMMQTIGRANPEVWTEPLRALHGEIDRLIALVDITPLLTALEQKEKELFAEARQALSDAIDTADLPAPLDSFYAQMKELILGFTDALFGDPDGTLREVNLSLTASMRPSTLFQPLDLAFDRLMAVVDALPEEQVLNALNAIREGIGAALPAMDPANMVKAMREAQERVAALSPANLAGVVSLPSLRTSLAAQLALTTEHGEAKASLLARFDVVLAPIELSADDSRLRELAASHLALVTALRRRINALDTSAAQAAFQRLDAGLVRILPGFLRQSAPLEMTDVRAGLATLRPSTKARRIDLAVDRFLAQLAPLQSNLEDAVGGFFQEIRQAALALHPGSLKDSMAQVYLTLHEKLDLLNPGQLAASVRTHVWDPLMEPLQAIDPSALKAQLNALFQELLARIALSMGGLLDQIKQGIDDFLLKVRQALSQALVALKNQIDQILADATALLARIDGLVVDDLFNRLLNLLANLQISFDQELNRVRNEFDSMLNAIPLKKPSARVATA